MTPFRWPRHHLRIPTCSQQDLNLRPLPCRGSALTGLRYTSLAGGLSFYAGTVLPLKPCVTDTLSIAISQPSRTRVSNLLLLVEKTGLEPVTFCLPDKRATNCATSPSETALTGKYTVSIILYLVTTRCSFDYRLCSGGTKGVRTPVRRPSLSTPTREVLSTTAKPHHRSPLRIPRTTASSAVCISPPYRAHTRLPAFAQGLPNVAELHDQSFTSDWHLSGWSFP